MNAMNKLGLLALALACVALVASPHFLPTSCKHPYNNLCKNEALLTWTALLNGLRLPAPFFDSPCWLLAPSNTAA